MDQTNSQKKIKISDKLFLQIPEDIAEYSVNQTIANQVLLEMNDGSITPTTLKARNFNTSLSSPTFTEEYEYQHTKVTRFGINIHSSDVQEIWGQIGRKSTEAPTQTSESGQSKASGSNQVLKKQVSIRQHLEASKNILIQLEEKNTNDAIQYLQSSENKVTLIDILERQKKNATTQEPKIHTVALYKVLYKTNDDTEGPKEFKYLVIDPSNSAFSSFLVAAHPHIRVCFEQMQIYKTPPKVNNLENVGSHPNEWGDCVDIAVKLAFHLQVNDKLGFLTLKSKELGDNLGYIEEQSLKEDPSVIEITNKWNICATLPIATEKYPCRVKQSSNVAESKKATAVLTTIDSISKTSEKILQEHKILTHEKINKLEKAFSEVIFSNKEYQEILNDAQSIITNSLQDKFFTKSVAIIGQDLELLGEEFRLIDASNIYESGGEL